VGAAPGIVDGLEGGEFLLEEAASGVACALQVPDYSQDARGAAQTLSFAELVEQRCAAM